MANQLGEAVYKINGDDTGLTQTLARDEQLIRTSVAKNQATFNTLTTSAQAVEGPTANATSAIGAFGAAAAISGSQTAGLAAQVANMGLQLKSALVGAALPLIAIAAVAAVIVGLMVAIWQRQAIADWIEGVKDAQEALEKLEDKLAAQRKRGDDFLKKQRETLLILQGTDPLQFLVPAEDLAEAQRNAAAIAQEKQKQADAEKAIADARARETAAEAKAKADAAKVEADAKQKQAEAEARVAAFNARIGPQTAAAARDLLTAQNRINIAKDHSLEVVEKELEVLLKIGLVTAKQADVLRKQAGIAAGAGADATATGTSSSIRLASFAGASLGTSSIAPIDTAQLKRDRTQGKDSETLTKIDVGIGRLVLATADRGLN